MRVIKLALISAVVFFVIATLFSLLIPSQVRISKAINVRSDKAAAMALVKSEAGWKDWHPAYIPNDSFQVPEITILSRRYTDSSVVMEIQQGGRQKFTSGWNFYEHAGQDSMTVQWYMDFKLQWYPWRKFGSLFYESTYGTMMQEGLENFREVLHR